MYLIQNARALATGAARNVNTNLVDANRARFHAEESVRLARAIKAMADRGELEIARQMVAEYREQRRIAEALEARMEATNG